MTCEKTDHQSTPREMSCAIGTDRGATRLVRMVAISRHDLSGLAGRSGRHLARAARLEVGSVTEADPGEEPMLKPRGWSNPACHPQLRDVLALG